MSGELASAISSVSAAGRAPHQMKIAFLTRNYPPDSLWGGDAVYYHNLARALAGRGHEVHVICQAVAGPGEYVEDGVSVHRVGTSARRYSVRARINYGLSAWRKLREMIKRHGIEIVEVPDWSAEGFLFSLRKQTPLVVTALGSTDDPLSGRDGLGIAKWASLRLLMHLTKRTYRKADKAIAISSSSYQAAVQRYNVDPRKLALVPIGIDTGKFRFTASDIRKRLSIPEGASVVLSVGRLEPRNGIWILGQAMPHVAEDVPGVRFVLVGKDTPTAPNNGSFKDHLMTVAHLAGLGRHILHIDFLSDDELVQLYSASDVFVYPALTSTFGLPVIEAMACGKPVVSTATGIVPELATYRLKGLRVVPSGDAEQLAQAISQSLRLAEQGRREIARESRDLVEAKFSIAAWIDKIIPVYSEMLETQE